MSRTAFTFLIISFISISCSSPQTKEDESFIVIDEKPEEIVEPVDPLDVYRKLESNSLSKHTSGGSDSITVLSSDKPQTRVNENNNIILTIPVGSEKDVSCNIIQKDILVGQNLLSHIKKLASSNNISSYTIHKYTTKLAGDIVHMNYIFDYYEQDKKFGNYKLSILQKPGFGAVICLHDEPGYYRTFHNVVDSLARSDYLKKRFTQFGAYKSRKIFIVSLNDKSVGYFESYTFYESSDVELNITTSVEAIPLNETQFAIRERKNIAYVSSVTGELLNQQSKSFDNGISKDNFTITKIDKGKYKIKGVFNKKPIQGELYTDLPVIDSESAILRIIKNYKQEIHETVVYSEFLTPYPNRFSKSELSLASENKGKYKIKYNSSFGLNMHIEADSTGTLQISMKVNDMEISIDRVFYKKKK